MAAKKPLETNFEIEDVSNTKSKKKKVKVPRGLDTVDWVMIVIGVIFAGFIVLAVFNPGNILDYGAYSMQNMSNNLTIENLTTNITVFGDNATWFRTGISYESNLVENNLVNLTLSCQPIEVPISAQINPQYNPNSNNSQELIYNYYHLIAEECLGENKTNLTYI